MSRSGVTLKRAFDFSFALVLLCITSPVILLCLLVASRETKSSGVFSQKRVGRHGRIISVLKIKTMHDVEGDASSITALNQSRITRSGAFFRRYKLDELPQLINVLKGEMSFVGPRPDVPGYADRLLGDDAVILELRPGITGPATIKYKDEESILASVADPKNYNDQVIWPDKVRMNREYYHSQNLRMDLRILFKTIFG